MTGTLSVAKNFVVDATVNLVSTFKPEDIVLKDFNFVPYVRNGLAAAIKDAPAPGGTRAKVPVSFEVRGDGATTQTVSRELALYGAGDVVGLDPGQIIRREPAPGTVNAEDTFMVQVEFDRPDIPWLFSPVGPVGSRLEPWLALVVCEREKSAILPPNAPGLPRVLVTSLGELQPLTDNAWFAHAQVVGGTNAPVADRLSDEHALANLSRLICPRKLDADKHYRAVLVPAFECGRAAGLGTSGGELEPAWTRAADNSDALTELLLPAYDTWDFSTADTGDFKSLAERIVPIGAPWEVGRRIIDASQPGGGLPGVPADTQGARQVLSCALRSPADAPEGAPDEEADRWPAAQRDALREIVDQSSSDNPLLPRVGPRLYARYQAGRNAVGAVFGSPPSTVAAADGNWFPQINTDPLPRIVAGLGTRVVQRDQEQLMQAAWAQVGEVNKLNHQLHQHQFAKALNESNLRRRIAALDLGQLTRLTRPLHDRIRIAARPESLWKQIESSRTAGSILSVTAKRMTNASAPAMRKGMALRDLAKAPDMVSSPAGFIDGRLPYANPDGITGFSNKGLEVLGPELVGRVLGVTPNKAFATFQTRVAPLADGTAIVRLSGGAATWQIQPDRSVGGLYAQFFTGRLDTRAPDPARKGDFLRAELAGLALAGIVEAAAPEFRDAGSAPIASLAASLPSPHVRRDIGAAASLPERMPIAARTPAAASAFGSRVLPTTAGRATSAASLFDRRGPVVVRPAPAPPPPPAPAPAMSPATRFETPLSRDLTCRINELSALKVSTLAQAFDAAINTIALPPPRNTATVPPLAVTPELILDAINPARTMTAYLKGRVRFWPDVIPTNWFDDLRIDPVMAAPVYKRAMYEALDAYDRDWLVPGLGAIAQPEFVTLLEANPAFCETFLIGLSDEMGRELLWRNYPTDQRGTYFKRFWDADEDELSKPIHKFSTTGPEPIGSHMAIGGGSGTGFRPVVLVLRGEIVRRYPDAIIAAVEAEPPAANAGSAFPPTFIAGSDARILFHAHLAPDYILVGFRLTIEEVRNGHWWFLLAEHPTAPRFGMAEAIAPNPRAAGGSIQQDNLDWNDLTGSDGQLDHGRFLSPPARTMSISDSGSNPAVQLWPGSSAVVARTLLRDPVRAAFEGKDLLNSIQNAGGPNA